MERKTVRAEGIAVTKSAGEVALVGEAEA